VEKRDGKFILLYLTDKLLFFIKFVMQDQIMKQHINRPESAGPKRQFGGIPTHLNTDPH